MTPNRAQIAETYRIFEGNPSMTWDGKYGFYGNGDVVLTISWKFDQAETAKITISKEGKVK